LIIIIIIEENWTLLLIVST